MVASQLKSSSGGKDRCACLSGYMRYDRPLRTAVRFRPHSVQGVLAPAAPIESGSARSHDTDVVVVGSGIGGLCCGALLARYGVKVTVCESHAIPGGAAHAWVKDGYHFESGPSLYSGMAGRGKSANPLAHVLQAVGEELELLNYDQWNVLVPEGEFLSKVGNENFATTLAKLRGPEAVREWRKLQDVMRPLAKAAALLPPCAIRADPGVALTAVARYLPSLLSGGPDALKLTGPFSQILDGVIHDEFTRNWMDLLCFLLSGLPANGTIAAEVAYMFNEWYRPDCKLDFPVGGSQAMVDALVRGLRKHGGRLLLSSHVERIVMEGGRAAGVALRGGGVVRARRGVVTNATLWDTLPLLPQEARPREWTQSVDGIPRCPSFMHLHLGLDATDLPSDLELHHIIVNTWKGGVTAPQNVVLVSIPSVLDPALAPPGKHSLHAYLPATEPYDIWDGVKRGSEEYRALKEERSRVLWDAVERVVPHARRRAEVALVGTPLTHQRFLRRHRGSYGPAIMAGTGALLPGPLTPVPGLYACGDTTFPGIGLPAVAASGAIAANSLVPVWDHWRLLDAIGV